MKNFYHIFAILLLFTLFAFTIAALAQDIEPVNIPDKNLEQVIRKQIGLPDTTPLTPIHMQMLLRLVALDASITDITGLEFATNLEILGLTNNKQLSDIRPIANLTKLKRLSFAGTKVQDLTPLAKLINLRTLYFWVTPISDLDPIKSLTGLVDIDASGCNISDVTPLASLFQLKYLKIRFNQIEDITPIENLKQLLELNLSYNKIVDVSPLVKLTNLNKLWIQGNQITDHSPLDTLSLQVFEYDELCLLPRLSITERMQNRRFPSVFTAWGGLGWSSVLNLPEKSDLEQMALHDLYFCCLIFGQKFRDTPDGKRVMGEMPKAIELRDAYLAQNPNMLFIAGLEMREAYPTSHPTDSPFWLRDENGDRVVAWKDGALLLDFTNPVVIDKIVNEAIAVAKCGLYDGIFFDWWNEHGPILVGWWNEHGPQGIVYLGNEAEQRARDEILRRIRAEVPDDFLILVNGNRRTMPRTAWAINGTFMETGKDYDDGYTYKGLKDIENTLSWAEENLREPRINCLEGWGVETQSPDSPLNMKWMRVFTTMSLTLSDGYVLYNDGVQHQHYWYPFWDTDLGKPISEKGQHYNNLEGVYIREFTNGWVVYNRSGRLQKIKLPSFSSSITNELDSTTHTLSDLDGEIYLKNIPDLNGDTVVNILDLVIVANAFGNRTPSVDLNGDGIVNILDLVIVANAFGNHK